MFKKLFVVFIIFVLLNKVVESNQHSSKSPQDSMINEIQNLISKNFYEIGKLRTYESHSCTVGTIFNLFYDSGFKIAIELNQSSNELRIIEYKYGQQDQKKTKKIQSLCPKQKIVLEQTVQKVPSSQIKQSITINAERRFRISDGIRLHRDEEYICQELSNIQGFPLDSILRKIRFSDKGYWVLHFFNERQPNFIYEYRARLDKNGKFQLLEQQRTDAQKQSAPVAQDIDGNTVIVVRKEQIGEQAKDKALKQVQSLVVVEKTVEKIIQAQQQSQVTSKLSQDVKLNFNSVSPQDNQLSSIVGLAVDALKYQYRQSPDSIKLIEVFAADKSDDLVVIKLFCKDIQKNQNFDFLFQSQRKAVKNAPVKSSGTLQFQQIPANLLQIPQFQTFISKILVENKAENHKLRKVQWCKQNNKKIKVILYNEAENREYFIQNQNTKIDELFNVIQNRQKSTQSQATVQKQIVQQTTVPIHQERVVEKKVEIQQGEKVLINIEKTYSQERLTPSDSSSKVFAEAQTTIKSKVEPAYKIQKYDLSLYQKIPSNIIAIPSFGDMILRILQQNIKYPCEIQQTYWKKNNNDQLLIEIKTADDRKQYIQASITNVKGIFIQTKKQKELIKESVQQNNIQKFSESQKKPVQQRSVENKIEISQNSLKTGPISKSSSQFSESSSQINVNGKVEIKTHSQKKIDGNVVSEKITSDTEFKQTPRAGELVSVQLSKPKQETLSSLKTDILVQAPRQQQKKIQTKAQKQIQNQNNQNKQSETPKELLKQNKNEENLGQAPKQIEKLLKLENSIETPRVQSLSTNEQSSFVEASRQQPKPKVQERLIEAPIQQPKSKVQERLIEAASQQPKPKVQEKLIEVPAKCGFRTQAIALQSLPFSKKDPQYLAFLASTLETQFQNSEVFASLLDFIAINRKFPTTSSFKVILINKVKFGIRVVLQQVKSVKLYEALVQFHQINGKYSFSMQFWKEINSLHEISADPFSRYHPLIERDSELENMLLNSFKQGSSFSNIEKLESVEKKVASNGIYFKCVFNSKDSKQFLTEILFNPEISSTQVIDYQQVNMPYDFTIEEDYTAPYDRDFEQVQDFLIDRFRKLFYGGKIVYVRKSPIKNLPEGKNIDNFRIVLTSNNGRYQVIVSYDYKSKQIKVYRFQQLDEGFKIPGFAGRKITVNENTVKQGREYLKKLTSLLRKQLAEDIKKDMIEFKEEFIETKDIPNYGEFYRVLYREPIPVSFTFFEDKTAGIKPAYLSSIEELPIFPTNLYYSDDLFRGYKQIRPSELKFNKAFLVLEEKARRDYADIIGSTSLIKGVFERIINGKNFYKIVYHIADSIFIGTCEYDPKNQIYQVLSVKKSDDLSVQGTYKDNCDKLDSKGQQCIICKKGFVETAGRCYRQAKGCIVQIGQLCYFCDAGFVQGSDKLCYKNPEKVISDASKVQVVKNLASNQNLALIRKDIAVEKTEQPIILQTSKPFIVGNDKSSLPPTNVNQQNLISVTKNIEVEKPEQPIILQTSKPFIVGNDKSSLPPTNVNQQNLISVTKNIEVEKPEQPIILQTSKPFIVGNDKSSLPPTNVNQQNLISVTKNIEVEKPEQPIILQTSKPFIVGNDKSSLPPTNDNQQNVVLIRKDIAVEKTEQPIILQTSKPFIVGNDKSSLPPTNVNQQNLISVTKNIEVEKPEQPIILQTSKPFIVGNDKSSLPPTNVNQQNLISVTKSVQRENSNIKQIKDGEDARSIPSITTSVLSNSRQSSSNPKTNVQQESFNQKEKRRSTHSSETRSYQLNPTSSSSSSITNKVIKKEYKQDSSSSLLQIRVPSKSSHTVSTVIQYSSATPYNDPNCLSYDGPNCKYCTYRYFLKDGFCNKIPDSCSSYDRRTGKCTSCYTGYYLAAGNCVERDPLCEQTNSRGQCIACFKNYILLEGKCYYQNSQKLRRENKRDSLCAQFEQRSGKCNKCVQGAYKNSDGQCKILDPNCEQFNQKYEICVKCIRGYQQIKGKCIKKTRQQW